MLERCKRFERRFGGTKTGTVSVGVYNCTLYRIVKSNSLGKLYLDAADNLGADWDDRLDQHNSFLDSIKLGIIGPEMEAKELILRKTQEGRLAFGIVIY